MGFLLAFCVPALLIVSIYVGPLAGAPNAWLCMPLLVAYLVIPLIQTVWPRPPYQVPEGRMRAAAWSLFYRALPLASAPAQLLMLATAAAAFVSGALSPAGRAVLLVTTGIFSAMFAINIAHELMHRRQRLDRYVAGILLSMVGFGTFKIVHLQIHHPHVGTPLDFATARRGQTIYSFWRQSFAGNFAGAVRCERARLARLGRAPWRSEIAVWSAFTAAWLALAAACWGWRGALFFALQGVIAIMYLDCINYLQHYGLMRQAGLDGRIEPVQDHHSWTQGMFLDDLILLNLPRHSNHHSHPQRPFQLLKDSEEAPRYPYSYAVMTLLLLAPPAFRRIVHPRLDRFQASRASVTA